MATRTAREKRAERQARNGNLVDMNLVSLIDVFTILIFFLLSSATGVETLVSPKAVKLPEARVDAAAKDGVVLVVAGDEILVDGRRVALVSQVLANANADADADDTVPALKAELDGLARRQALPVQPGTDTSSPARRVTLMADKDMPYRLLRKLMASCAAAGYGDLQFAVRRKEGA